MGAIPNRADTVLENQNSAPDNDSTRAVIKRVRRLFETNKDEAMANDRKTVTMIREYLVKKGGPIR
jgi:hypothetical protein